MGLTLLQLIMKTMLLISSLSINGASSSLHHRSVEVGDPAQDKCPPCELLFTKLQSGGRNGKLTQFVRVQERGEPKSGTGFMYFWATATFIRTCRYLQGLYGKQMCVPHCRGKPATSYSQVRYGNFRPGVDIQRS